jgi:hypothetical protein
MFLRTIIALNEYVNLFAIFCSPSQHVSSRTAAYLDFDRGQLDVKRVLRKQLGNGFKLRLKFSKNVSGSSLYEMKNVLHSSSL